MEGSDLGFRIHDVEEHLIQSHVIAETFRVKVLQPVSRVDGSERFSVLYTTDSDYFFGGYESIARELQALGETPRFILVSIGYENSRAVELLRWRDFATHGMRESRRDLFKKMAEWPLVNRPDLLPAVLDTTDATQFLQFIAAELMPFINGRYPTRSGESLYYGYSAGGLFGLYALFTRPQTFTHYILGSPGTSYMGRDFAVELAQSFIRSKQTLQAKVYLSVGELEEFRAGHEPYELVTSYYRLTKFLKQAAIPGLDLQGQVFPGETHATAWTLSLIHGLKTLLGPAERVPFMPSMTN